MIESVSVAADSYLYRNDTVSILLEASKSNQTVAVDWIDWKRNEGGRGTPSTGIFIACTRPRTRGRHIPVEATFLQSQLSLDTARRRDQAVSF